MRSLYLALLIGAISCTPRDEDKLLYDSASSLACSAEFFDLPGEDHARYDEAGFLGKTIGYPTYEFYDFRVGRISPTIDMEGLFGLWVYHGDQTYLAAMGTIEGFSFGDYEAAALDSYAFDNYVWCEDGTFVGELSLATYNFLMIAFCREATGPEEFWVAYDEERQWEMCDFWLLDGAYSSSMSLQEHVATMSRHASGKFSRVL